MISSEAHRRFLAERYPRHIRMQRFIQHITRRQRRHRRVRARVCGNAERPRLSVYRSSAHCTAQVIDDTIGRTIVAASDGEVQSLSGDATRKVSAAHALGKLIAERARAKGVTRVVFDRGGYAYHGRVRAIAEGAREGGLEF